MRLMAHFFVLYVLLFSVSNMRLVFRFKICSSIFTF